MSNIDRQQAILNILQGLNDLDGLKRLFWQELNYERENRPLSPRQWPESARQPLAEDPILFASGGEDNAFHIVYCRLDSDVLLRGSERQIVNSLTREHPYALFVFSNKLHTEWHFINIKYDENAEKRRLVRRIPVRPGEGLRTAAERLQMLDLEAISPDLFTLSPLTIQQRHDDAFDVEKVTKDFYREIANWYFWALKHPNVSFPRDVKSEQDQAIFLIRLLTRLIFCWFTREKGLIPKKLFNNREVTGLLKDTRPEAGTYYQAVLQNLFFATLNQESDKRKFRVKHEEGRDGNRGATNLYRFANLLTDPDALLDILRQVPFINGGLFDCLDTVYRKDEGRPDVRMDDFSEERGCGLCVPNELFFGASRRVDLNALYGDKLHGDEAVRGLIHTLSHYQFTVEENTPFDQSVALDPELLGKVFENLLAAYNPETGTTARKATGSFYTPREIVDYMVDESLIAYLDGKLTAKSAKDAKERMRALLAYDSDIPAFSEVETEALIEAIDGLKALDPAVGSGAFPMGMLHKLVHVLARLDPGNERWKAKQIAKLEDAVMREDAERIFRENYDDYGRKLYLIENCIYGVDIQPIAVQIAKMRFFISLIVDQKVNPKAPNLGVRALPNLETKFVAANTLIGIEKPESQGVLFSNDAVNELKRQLVNVRHRMFNAKTLKTKSQLRKEDKGLRELLAERLKESFTHISNEELERLKKELADAHAALEAMRSEPAEWKVTRFVNLFGEKEETRVNLSKDRIKHLKDSIKKLEFDLRGKKQFTQEIDEATKQLAAWDPYDQNTHADFFDPEWMFGVNDGFDVVIGNPPYLESRSPAFTDSLKVRLQQALVSRWPGISVAESVPRGADLLVYFFETAVHLVAESGIVTFITQNAWLDTEYGKKFQTFILDRTHVAMVVDSNCKHFDSTGGPNINTVITFFHGRKPAPDKFITFVRFQDIMKSGYFSASGGMSCHADGIADYKQYPYSSKDLRVTKWGILLTLDDVVLDLLSELRDKATCIEDLRHCRLSIGQGLNLTSNYYVSPDSVAEHPFVSKALVPIYSAEDGALFSVRSTSLHLVNAQKLTSNEIRTLQSIGIQPFNPKSTSKRPPILIMPRGIGRYFCALNPTQAFSSSGVDVYADDGGCDEDTLYSLWAVLNSSVAWLLREATGRKNLGGGMLKAEAVDLKALPIFLRLPGTDEIKGVAKALARRQALDSVAEIDTQEHRRLDDLVFDCLKVDTAKRRIIIDSLRQKIERRMRKSKT